MYLCVSMDSWMNFISKVSIILWYHLANSRIHSLQNSLSDIVMYYYNVLLHNIIKKNIQCKYFLISKAFVFSNVSVFLLFTDKKQNSIS